MATRVRLFRPQYQRRARTLPAAGFFEAAGLNPVAVGASVVFALAAALTVFDAHRPVAVVLRSGLLIAGRLGQGYTSLSWTEITAIDSDHAMVSITTSGRQMYQLHIDSRAAGFIARMTRRMLFTKPGAPLRPPL